MDHASFACILDFVAGDAPEKRKTFDHIHAAELHHSHVLGDEVLRTRLPSSGEWRIPVWVTWVAWEYLAKMPNSGTRKCSL